MTTINERTPENTPPTYYAVFKADNAAQNILHQLDKLRAYNKLIENKMNLPNEDASWKFIDEPYEYYRNTANSNQLLDGLPVQRETK